MLVQPQVLKSVLGPQIGDFSIHLVSSGTLSLLFLLNIIDKQTVGSTCAKFLYIT